MEETWGYYEGGEEEEESEEGERAGEEMV